MLVQFFGSDRAGFAQQVLERGLTVLVTHEFEPQVERAFDDKVAALQINHRGTTRCRFGMPLVHLDGPHSFWRFKDNAGFLVSQEPANANRARCVRVIVWALICDVYLHGMGLRMIRSG